MVVGEWRLPATGQGRVCAGTLGLLLDRSYGGTRMPVVVLLTYQAILPNVYYG